MTNRAFASLYAALAIAILLSLASPSGAQFVPGGFRGGSCTAPDFVRAISNTGTFTCATPAAGGIAIGDAVTGGTANRILHLDGSGNLDDTANFDITAARVRFPVPLVTGGTAPTMGACGTSPSVAGNDMGMLVTVGTGGVALSCTVNFSQTYTNPPVCHAANDTDYIAYRMTVTTTAVTAASTAAITASSKLNIICIPRA